MIVEAVCLSIIQHTAIGQMLQLLSKVNQSCYLSVKILTVRTCNVLIGANFEGLIDLSNVF